MACKVADPNDVTCVPANGFPQGEALGMVRELSSYIGHSGSAQKKIQGLFVCQQVIFSKKIPLKHLRGNKNLETGIVFLRLTKKGVLFNLV